MNLAINPAVEPVFEKYPIPLQEKLKLLRTLIIETAREIESIKELEETLKWGEPSYLAKKGSTIRINAKKASHTHYAIYFKCTSKLVPTFRAIYPDTFTYEGNRAIVFNLDSKIPIQELKHCISLALTYHWVKHLPLLGNNNL